MKRLLSAVLVLLVGVVPVAAVATQERVPVEHLLWDIPFGIGREECMALIRELVGVELVENETEWGSVYFSSPGRELRICDCAVELLAEFDDDETLKAISVEGICDVPQDEWKEFAAKYLQFTLGLVEKAEQNYGEALGGIVSIDYGAQKYSLPILHGVPSKSTLSDVFEEDIDFFTVHYLYDGASVFVALSRDYGSICFFVSVGLDSLECTHRMLYDLENMRDYSDSREDVQR